MVTGTGTSGSSGSLENTHRVAWYRPSARPVELKLTSTCWLPAGAMVPAVGLAESQGTSARLPQIAGCPSTMKGSPCGVSVPVSVSAAHAEV